MADDAAKAKAAARAEWLRIKRETDVQAARRRLAREAKFGANRPSGSYYDAGHRGWSAQ